MYTTKFTREYVGGVIAGVGLGFLIAHSLVRSNLIGEGFNPILVIGGFILIAIGGSLARSGQKRRQATAQEKQG